MSQKVVAWLWFEKDAEEALDYYASVFKDFKLIEKTNYPEGVEIPGSPQGSLMTARFEIFGIEFAILNGGPAFKFNEAVSFLIKCEDQKEVDYYWEKLSAVKESEQCGWCKDKYGVSWQIVPNRLDELAADPDKEKAARVMEAMLKMHKIVIADLEKAAEGK